MRRARSRTAVFLLFCLAFNWLAAAAHACITPMQMPGDATSAHCEQMALAAAPVTDSAMALCLEHCDPDEVRASDLRGAFELPPSAAAVDACSVPLSALPALDLPRAAPRALGPPPLQRFCVLLI